MPSKTTHRLLLIVPVLLVAALAWGWWYMAAGRFPLAGSMHHDFGTVSITGQSSDFLHTFHLRNRTSEPVVIETIRSGCGCTKAEASATTIAPGETVDVDIRLSLARAGKKRTSVKLVIADFGPQTLWIEAVGRKETTITSPSSSLLITPGQPAQLTVMAEIQSSDEAPPPPSVVKADGVIASFRGWKAVTARDPGTARAAQWRGIFDVNLTEGAPATDSDMTISLGTAPPVHVKVIKRGDGV